MTGCVTLPTEPPIHLTTTILPSAILALPPPPPLLTPEEELSPWGLEYRLGRHFAIDGDYYRAVTCFHRSRYLLDSPSSAHAAQLLHALLITYSLGGKYQEAINVWEAQQNTTHLDDPDLARDCIGLLYEAYTHINQPQKAEELL